MGKGSGLTSPGREGIGDWNWKTGKGRNGIDPVGIDPLYKPEQPGSRTRFRLG